jgi:hypothetical protein
MLLLAMGPTAIGWCLAVLSVAAASDIDNPYPSDGESSLMFPKSLSWDAVAGAHGYDVYLGKHGIAPLDKIADNVPSAFGDFPPVEFGET